MHDHRVPRPASQGRVRAAWAATAALACTLGACNAKHKECDRVLPAAREVEHSTAMIVKAFESGDPAAVAKVRPLLKSYHDELDALAGSVEALPLPDRVAGLRDALASLLAAADKLKAGEQEPRLNFFLERLKADVEGVSFACER